jgi:hypothetical protein
MHCIAHYSSGPPGVQTPSVRNSLERPDRPATSAGGTPVLGLAYLIRQVDSCH